MSQFFKENFQGSSSIPSDVTVSLTGTLTSSLSTSTSPQFPGLGPNSVQISNPSAGVLNSAVNATVTDSSSGNLSVTASIMFSNTGSNSYAGVFLGIGSQFNPAFNGTGYRFYINTTGITIDGFLSGVSHNVVSNAFTVTWPANQWITFTLVRNHSTLWGIVKREDTQQYLTNGAVWQADYVEAAIGTDSTPLSYSASYPGVYLGVPASGTANVAQLVARDQVTNVPLGPFKGVDITTFPYPGWTPRATTGMFTQIDLAKTIGCNAIRIQPLLPGVYQGTATLADILPLLQQTIVYAKNNGVWVLLTEDQAAPYGSLHTWAEASAQMISDRVAIAAAISSYPNVVGFELVNEIDLVSTWNMYNGSASVAGTLSVSTALYASFLGRAVAAIRAVAPNLPIGGSFATGSPIGNQTQYANLAYFWDFMDNHVYTNPTGSMSNVYAFVGTYGKPIIIGETGGTSVENASTINTRITALWPDIVTATYSGQPGCTGAWFWTLMPPSLSTLTLFPGTIPETLDNTFGATWSGFAAPQYSFLTTPSPGLSLIQNSASDKGPMTGIGLFSGSMTYVASSATLATLTITLTNTTNPSAGGYITAFAFGNPSSLITGVKITFNNTGMDVIGASSFSGGIDCLNATTSWGNADIGLSVGTDWNTSGTLKNYRAGIRNSQTGTIVLSLVGTSLTTLTNESFHNALTSGSTKVFFPVHFRYLKGESTTTSGDDLIASL